jgi:hypothetical protein
MARPDSAAPKPAQPSSAAGLSLSARIRLFFARAWQAAREVGTVLHACRFSLFMVLAGGTLMFASSQGRDLAVGLTGAPLLAQVAFQFAVLLWAFESWYWSRLLLDVTYGLDRRRPALGARPYPEAWTIRNAPRVIGAGAYVVAGIAVGLASAWIQFGLLAVAGTLFYVLLVKRVAITNRLHAMLGRPFDAMTGPPRVISGLRDLPPFSQAVLWGSFALALVATARAVQDPVAFGWMLGAAAVPFLGFALIVPVGSLLVYLFRLGGDRPDTPDIKGYPVVTMLALVALVVGALVDNHAVRTLPVAAGAAGPAMRATLPEAALRWHAAASKAAGHERPPLIVIATAGGGLRAAYWTATVLGALEDEAPGFAALVFAISGVSGGSVGATVFATLLADGPGTPQGACRRKPYECAGQAVLAQDFLAPNAASLIFPDLMQRFVPIAVFPEDRAAALERSWERAWARAGLAPDTWTERRFTRLEARDGSWVPVLLLNGTHVETGRRIITSTVRFGATAFPDAYDFFALVSGDVRMSTAALNSARFPYVSPAGTLLREGQNVGHIVDGGYFENFGAATALQAFRAALRVIGEAGKWAEPFLIQISSDPAIASEDLDVDGTAGPSTRRGNRVANETLSPPLALLNARDARGLLAYKEFLASAPAHRRAHFQLCSALREDALALGWVLAAPSLELMRAVLRDGRCGNAAELKRVVEAVRGGP